jgi:hypothetical protein
MWVLVSTEKRLTLDHRQRRLSNVMPEEYPLRVVRRVVPDVSEEVIASIFRVEE